VKISRDRLNLSAHASRMSENSQFSAQPKMSITPIIAISYDVVTQFIGDRLTYVGEQT
jgi:hypothetical protein